MLAETSPVFPDIFPTGAALKAVWYGAETFGKLIAMGRPASAAGEGSGSSGSSVPVRVTKGHPCNAAYRLNPLKVTNVCQLAALTTPWVLFVVES